MARASRSKRSLASALSERCVGRILIATVRSRRVSRARYTSPIPPAPSGATIWYGPSLVPWARVIGGQNYNLREHRTTPSPPLAAQWGLWFLFAADTTSG